MSILDALTRIEKDLQRALTRLKLRPIMTNERNEPNHTPEPWHIKAGPSHYLICDRRGRVIADMRLPDDNGVPIEEVDANAKLLAAAPKTASELDRLRKVLQEICNELYGKGFEVSGWHLNGALKPLDTWFDDNGWCEAAIAKGKIEEACCQAGREQSTPEAVGQARADRGFSS